MRPGPHLSREEGQDRREGRRLLVLFTCDQLSQTLISHHGLEVRPSSRLCLLPGSLNLHLCLLKIFHLLILSDPTTSTCLRSPGRIKLFTNPVQHVEELWAIVFQLSCNFHHGEPLLQTAIHVDTGHDLAL